MLTETNSAEKIWKYLKTAGLSDQGVAGLMGNLYAESALSPTNLQNSFEKKLGYTDATYTEAVDNGSYTNFIKDGAGYGLAQWTFYTRKAALLAFAQAKKQSVGNLEVQLDFLLHELKTSYSSVLTALERATDVAAASNTVLLKFERPADQGERVKQRRAQYAQTYYDRYAARQKPVKEREQPVEYTNSPLVTYTRISPNRSSSRTHVIDTITIHCIVAQWTAQRGCDYFADSKVKASANYVVGKDGSIGLSVEEKDRSWCSSNKDNDHRAVTIEVASDTTHPYAVTPQAYAALLNLVTDICKRNGIQKLLWKGDKSLVGQVDKQNMTVHRWFANKACPGDYLYSRHGEIAEEVNRRLGAAETPCEGHGKTAAETNQRMIATAVPYEVRITVTNLRIRNGPGTDKGIVGVIKPGKYMIIEEADGAGAFKWGKVQELAGWVSLKYCTKI